VPIEGAWLADVQIVPKLAGGDQRLPVDRFCGNDQRLDGRFCCQAWCGPQTRASSARCRTPPRALAPTLDAATGSGPWLGSLGIPQRAETRLSLRSTGGEHRRGGRLARGAS